MYPSTSRTIHLIHGFNVWDGGKATIGKFQPFLATKYDTRIHTYQMLLFVKWRNTGRAREFSKFVKPGDIGIGHSNGCAILAQMVEEFNAPFAGLVFINPALDRDHTVPNVDWVHVYFNKGDIPVRIAKWIPKHPWGEMGRVGYKGSAINHKSVNCYTRSPSLYGHSDMFHDGNYFPWIHRVEHKFAGELD